MAGNVFADLVVRVTGDISPVVAAFGQLKTEMGALQTLGAGMTAVGAAMTAGITVPIAAIGVASLKSAMDVQSANNQIRAQTGATGAELSKLEGLFSSLAVKVPNSFSDIATAISTVFPRLKDLGYNIDEVTHNVLDMSRMTGESVKSMGTDVTEMLINWKVPVKDAESAINDLYRAYQVTKVPVSDLTNLIDKQGQVLRQSYGFSLKDSIALMASFKEAGLDTSDLLRGMDYGWAKLSQAMDGSAAPAKAMVPIISAIGTEAKKMGLDVQEPGQRMEAFFAGIKDGTVKAGDAMAVFGPRFGSQIVDNIKEGNLNLAEFDKMMSENKDTVEAAGQASLTFGQRLTMMRHGLEIALAPVGQSIMDTLEGFFPIILLIIDYIGKLASAFNQIPTPLRNMIILFAGIAAAAGPLIMLFGFLISSFATVAAGSIAFVSALITLAPVLILIAAVVAPIVVALAALAAGLLLAYTYSQTFRNLLGTLGGDLATFGGQVVQAFSFFTQGKWSEGINSLKTAFTGLYNDLKSIDWASVGQKIINDIISGVKGLINTLTTVWNDISNGFTSWVNSVNWADLAKKIPQDIANGIKTITTLLGSVWTSISNGFTTWVNSVNWSDLAKKIPQDIANGIKYITTLLGAIWDTITKSFTTWRDSVNWNALAKKIGDDIGAGIKGALGTIGAIWDVISNSFNTWRNSVNWESLAGGIAQNIINGLKTIQTLVDPIWNAISTSFTTWKNSVNWTAIGQQIPADIASGIKLGMDTIGPVWDYIQTSLINWLNSVKWDSVGQQIGLGIRNAIKLALDSLVGGLGELIPTGKAGGGANLFDTGVSAAKSFISGLQSGLGDLWKLIMDGLEPLAGKIADYMENQVDWKGIGNAIGTILGSIIAGVTGAPLAELNGAPQQQLNIPKGMATSINPSDVTAANIKLAQGPATGLAYNAQGQAVGGMTKDSGWDKLQKAGEDAGNALATGFTKGVQDAMANINWGDVIKNALLNSVGLGSKGSGKNALTGDPTGVPGIMAGLSQAGGMIGGGLGIIGGGIMGGLGGIGSWLGSPKSPFGAMGGALGGIGGALGNLLNVGPLPPFPNLGLFPWDKKDSSGKPIQPSPFPGLTGAIDLPSKLGALGTIDWGGVGKTFGNFTSGLGNVNFPDLGKSFSGIASGLPQVNFPDLGKTFGSFASIKLPDLSKIQLPDFSKLLSGFQLPDFSKLLSGIQLPDLSKLFGGFKLPEIKMPDFGSLIPKFSWPQIKLPDFGSIIPKFSWPSIKLPDLGSLIPKFSWPSIKLPDLGSLVPKFSWPSLPSFSWPGLPAFSWPGLPAFSWPSIPGFAWPSLPAFSWPGIPAFAWPALPAFAWPSIPSIDLGQWVPNLTWPGIPSIDLGRWVPGFTWPGIPSIDLGRWVPGFTWPGIPSIDLGRWVPGFSWPAVPGIDLGRWIPSFSWPSIAGIDLGSWIPAFPGWPSITGTGGVFGAAQSAFDAARSVYDSAKQKGGAALSAVQGKLHQYGVPFMAQGGKGGQGQWRIIGEAGPEAVLPQSLWWGVDPKVLAALPRFASGAYITDRAQFALLGEAGPEAVIPKKYWSGISPWVLNALPKFGSGGVINTSTVGGSSAPSTPCISVNVTGNTILNDRDAQKLGDTILNAIKHKIGSIR